jgi:protein-S-isoprenylcysteine O-methyltransferase Ste14
MSPIVRLIVVLGSSALYFGLAVWGSGGPALFFAHPAFWALTIVFSGLAVVGLYAGGNISPGVREDRANRWVLPAFAIIGALSAYLPAWSDRVDFLTFGGDGLRWIGVALAALGGGLRLYPVIVLGDRFSGLVAIQRGHRLETQGVYAHIRHPSYLGLLIAGIGWALAFRSGLGLLLVAALIPPLLARIQAEEALFADHFGAEYQAYCASTARMIPGLW